MQQPLVLIARILAALVRVMEQRLCGRRRRPRAITNASMTSCLVIRSLRLQPTIIREHTSTSNARYSQPSRVGMNVMSATHVSFGRFAWNRRCRRFGATGSRCDEVVVRVKARRYRALRPSCRISRATRCRPQWCPRARSSACTRGLPYTPRVV